jgi:hypothetical protein
MSPTYYKYLLGQWQLCKVDEVYIQNQVTLAHLTQAEADQIIATPRNCP